MTSPLASPSSRNAGIDRLRGVAILMVLLLHFSETYLLWDRGPLVDLVGPNWAWSMLGWGNFGVTVFFVVSGYLIASNAIQRAGALGRLNLRAFYIRRFARIAPCLLLALAIIVPLGLLGVPAFRADGPHPTRDLFLGTLSVLGFFHNILMQKFGYFDYCLNVYWSLSVEEVFYFGFPLGCLALRRDLLIALACMVFIALAPGFRAAHADNDIYYLYANLACFDAISIGILAALLAQRWRPGPRIATALQSAGWVLLAAIWLRGFGGHHKIFGFTWIALATACVITGTLTAQTVSRRASASGRIIEWVGRHSYELYLFHIVIPAAMRDLIPANSLVAGWQIPWLLLFLALSAGAAAVAAKRLGEPANRFLRQSKKAVPF